MKLPYDSCPVLSQILRSFLLNGKNLHAIGQTMSDAGCAFNVLFFFTPPPLSVNPAGW